MARERKNSSQNLEMRGKPDGGGCLSATDEEREPCLKESTHLSPVTDKNNGTSNGKSHVFAAATNLEQKLRDKTGFSRTGLAVVLFITLVVLLFVWT